MSVYREIRETFGENGEKWGQGLARSARGKHCLLDGITRVLITDEVCMGPEGDYSQSVNEAVAAAKVVARVISEKWGNRYQVTHGVPTLNSSIARFNDAGERTFSDIEYVLDEAERISELGDE